MSTTWKSLVAGFVAGAVTTVAFQLSFWIGAGLLIVSAFYVFLKAKEKGA